MTTEPRLLSNGHLDLSDSGAWGIAAIMMCWRPGCFTVISLPKHGASGPARGGVQAYGLLARHEEKMSLKNFEKNTVPINGKYRCFCRGPANGVSSWRVPVMRAASESCIASFLFKGGHSALEEAEIRAAERHMLALGQITDLVELPVTHARR